MFRKLFVLLIYFFYNFDVYVICRISNERRCVDPECSVPISIGRTLVRYNADDERLLSFPQNVKVTIYSKEAGNVPNFWEAKIDGKRGYVPKSFVREEKVLVKPNDVKLILPTEEIENPNHVTQNITEEIKKESFDLNKTPELPVANSKGMFNLFEGVSADSVPPNSPDIKPQTTEKFQVVDGTTIYDDDQIDGNLESIPPHNADVNETPLKDNDNLQENESLQENLKVEDSDEQERLNMETAPNIETNPEGSSESVVETSESLQVASGTIEKVNIDKVAEPTSESVLGQIVKQVTSIISSGTGGIKNEVEEEEEEDEYYEDENGSAEYSDGDETGSVNDLNGDKIENPSFKNDEEIKHTTSSTEINTPPSDNKINESVNESPNISIEDKKSDIAFESEHILEKSNLSKSTLNEGSMSEMVKQGEAMETEVKINEQAKLSVEVSRQTQLNELDENITNLNELDENITNLNELDENITKEKEDSTSNDFINNIAHPRIDAFPHNADVVRTQEDNLSKYSTNEKTLDENVAASSDLFNDMEPKTASSGKELLEAHIPTAENPELVVSSQNINKIVPDDNTVLTTTVTGNLNVIVDSIDQKLSSSDDSGNIEGISNNVNDQYNERPEVKEPGISLEQTLPLVPEIDKAQIPLYKSAQNESLNSENPSVSEITQASDSHSSSESKRTLPIFSNILKESTDLPSFPSEDFEINDSNTETIIDLNDSNSSETRKEDEFQESPANSMPDIIDEILKAEEEIKAKLQHSSLRPKERDGYSYDAEANKDDVIKEAHENSGGLFSWMNPVFDLLTSQVKLFETSSTSSSDGIVDVLESDTLGPSRAKNIPADDGSCPSERYGEGDCEFVKDVPKGAEDLVPLELRHRIPLEITVYLVITSVVLLIFSLGHYYIEAHRRDGPLVAVINKFEKEVLFLKQENSHLDDKLQTALQQLEDWNTNSSENDTLIVELRQELEETKVAKQDLEEQVALLEREVESVTENGLEMHRLLEESLSSQDGSQVLLSTVETLREKLERQEEEIAALSHSLSRKNVEVEELEKKLSQSAEVASGLEERIIAITRDKEEEALQLKDKHRQLTAQLEEVMETKALDDSRISAKLSKLRLTIEDLQKTVAEKDAELEEVKEVVKQLRSTDTNDKMDTLFDVVSVRAQLRTAVGEREDFRERFLEEEGARKLLEGHMTKITQEVAELKNNFEAAEKDKIEALTKLQVLSNYFKEKESQLQKELGLQESMWLQKQSDDHSIYEQMRSLREENEKYKLQNESLKKEIVEQESSFKIQIANVEQKSHENWVASRQAERRLKEVQQEAAQLRNRLTMEKHSANYSMEDGKPISESNGDPSSPPPSLMFPPTSSPPFMMYPMPPPGDFVPLPPLMGSPYPSDSRPPPLGRISSPSLDHRFSPPPPLPYPPFDYPSYGHHSPSPPPPIPSHSHHRNVHKPQPREMSREQKEHTMSNYSPEGDNTVRKNKR